MNVKVRTRKRKSGTAVMLDYHDANGKRHQRIVGKASTQEALGIIKDKADREAKRIEYELVEGKHRPAMGEESIDGMLVEFWDHLEASTLTTGTKENYRAFIKLFRAFLKGTRARRLKDVTPSLIVKYVKTREGRAANTIAKDLRCLHRIFGRCVVLEMIAANPLDHPDVKDIRPEQTKHERVFTDEELRTFLDAVRNQENAEAESVADFLTMLSETGLRLTEGLMLRWCDIHFGEDAFLRVEPRAGWAPKTKRSIRTVPLSPGVEDMLKRRLKVLDSVRPAERIFPTAWTRNQVGGIFRGARKAAKLDVPDERGQLLVVHSLRHYFASVFVRNGADPATVRDLLGHDSITTTNRYFNTPRRELFNTVREVFSRHKNVTDSSGLYRFPAERVTTAENGR